MNPAVASMLEKYDLRSAADYVHALREILQEIALCGLWRGKFFEKAAMYGGTALRVLYGLDRFSEDMDFSLLKPGGDPDLARYWKFVEKELNGWGFTASLTPKKKTARSAVESAFLKTGTRESLLAIDASPEITGTVHPRQRLRIRIEVDTDPPPGFNTQARVLLQPIPFSVRVYDLPSLFAGKMHAVLCRDWATRVKGRDWYDFVWHVGRGTELDLNHLEARMRQSGHYREKHALDAATFIRLLKERIETVNLERARREVERFLPDPASVEIWSRSFFHAVAEKTAFKPT
jgi:predicted nucleotidyltransferase component of viral defense system